MRNYWMSTSLQGLDHGILPSYQIRHPEPQEHNGKNGM